jgi:hypothetical protein
MHEPVVPGNELRHGVELYQFKISRGTSGAHRREICPKPLRTAEISASRSEREFVSLLWSRAYQHKTRPIGRLARPEPPRLATEW